jgi:hypothetical protein
MRFIAPLTLCLLAATAALPQHLASDKRVEVRAAISLLWYATANIGNAGSDNTTFGAFPIELGIALRPTPDMSIALTGRLGLVHYGGGLELSRTFAGDWGHDGIVVRLAPQIIRDAITCFAIEGPRPCDTATYFMVEAGAAYRWAFRSTGGFSIGAALTAGDAKLTQSDGSSGNRFVYGLLAPRFAFDF